MVTPNPRGGFQAGTGAAVPVGSTKQTRISIFLKSNIPALKKENGKANKSPHKKGRLLIFPN